MPDRAYHATIDRLPRHPSPTGAVHRAILETDGASIQFTWVDAGAWLAPPNVGPGEYDRHAFDQTHIVISGRLEMTLEERVGEARVYELGPGELLYIPGDVPHRGRAIGDDPVYAIEVFAPARADFHDLAVEHQPGFPAAP